MVISGNEVFAEAEDGAILRITSHGPIADADLTRIWPPRGLRRLESRAAGKAATVQLDPEGDPGHLAAESRVALFTAEHLRHLVAVHAALIRWRGHTIVVPGPSHTGKSTLALAAGEAGAVVGGDEYVLIDPASGIAAGWPRPLRRRTAGGTVRVARHRWIEPAPITLVAGLDYSNAGTHIRELTAADTAIRLLSNTVCARIRPDDSYRAAVTVARHARGVGGTRGEATETIPRLLALTTGCP